jgi:hypothetical protein
MVLEASSISINTKLDNNNCFHIDSKGVRDREVIKHE